MAALVQSFPQQSSTVTMLQPRPSSSSGAFSNSQAQHQSSSRSSQMSRNIYNGSQMGAGNYRGQAPTIAPYAFTGVPIQNGANPLRQNPTPHLRMDSRTSSAPVIPQLSFSTNNTPSTSHQRHPANASISTSSSASSNGATNSMSSKDDSAIHTSIEPVEVAKRPVSMLELGSVPLLSPQPDLASPVKPSPDRYRRVQRRTDPGTTTQPPQTNNFPSGSGMATVGHLYNHPGQSNSSPSLQSYPSYRGSIVQPGDASRQARPISIDDMHIPRQSSSEQAKRYRRRSMGGLETGAVNALNNAAQIQSLHSPPPPVSNAAYSESPAPGINTSLQKPLTNQANVSSESVSSSRSAKSNPRPSSVSPVFDIVNTLVCL